MSRAKFCQSLLRTFSTRTRLLGVSQPFAAARYFSITGIRQERKHKVDGHFDNNTSLLEPPPFSDEELNIVKKLNADELKPELKGDLPSPPDMSEDFDPRFLEELLKNEHYEKNVENEHKTNVEDNERLPPPPPNILQHSPQQSEMYNIDDSSMQSHEFEALLQAVNRAVDTRSRTRGPMPLHELANRSIKIKELVKLGVDLSSIALRHAQLERLLHLNWDSQIKPHIRLLVDLGIEPDRLGAILTSNPVLLWTSAEDLEVRKNYLIAKGFTEDMIRHIFNEAPFWLTLSTRQLDFRLGYFQKTFQLTGNEVRKLAVDFPKMVSTPVRWDVIVNTTKLMDRQFGFNEEERKLILLKNGKCYMRPKIVCDAFEYLHHEVGLSHSQIVQHATLLTTRLHKLKPRHLFLKFIMRDRFDPLEPGYVSPDWLWQGTEEEFCQTAAKKTLEDYELFLRTL